MKFIKYKYDNIGKIDAIQLPILLLHGTKDNKIPYEQSRTLFTKAIANRLNNPNYQLIAKKDTWYSISNSSNSNCQQMPIVYHELADAGHNSVFKTSSWIPVVLKYMELSEGYWRSVNDEHECLINNY